MRQFSRAKADAARAVNRESLNFLELQMRLQFKQ
jgi:hypothetical protein